MVSSIEQPFDNNEVQQLIRGALQEDRAAADVTVSSLGIGDNSVRATIAAGGDGVICALPIVGLVYHELAPTVNVQLYAGDGDVVVAGKIVAKIEGPANAVLSGERVALNIVGHLSGVATLAAAYVAAVRGRKTVILDTRKTTPLLRDLEKYAVRMGGAQNHRRDLSSMVLVKENHFRALGGSASLLSKLAAVPGDVFVEVEVDTLDLLREVLPSRVDRIMLDNFVPDQVREAVAMVRKERDQGRVLELEVSGGVTLDTVADYAIDGVDFISVGALTHSSSALPLSMQVETDE